MREGCDARFQPHLIAVEPADFQCRSQLRTGHVDPRQRDGLAQNGGLDRRGDDTDLRLAVMSAVAWRWNHAALQFQPYQLALRVGLALFQTGYTVDLGRLSAASACVLVPSVLAFVLLRRNFVQSVAATGMKE